jgi:uncharacterized protein YkwD
MKFVLLIVLVLAVVACPSVFVAERVFPMQASPSGGDFVPVTGSGSFQGCGGEVFSPINEAFEQAVVEQTNQIRMDAGLTPLKRVESLDNSARYHTADMGANDYFSHDTFDRVDGSLVRVCDTWSRIEAFYTDWYALAENIAAGQRSPESAMEGWMNSPDHRHNILSDNYWEIGVGYYEGSGEYRYYWGQNFGRTESRYPLVIDGEKAITASATVPLYVYGDWDEIRLRNDAGEWSAWMPFANHLTWTLPETPGEHTVSAEMRSRVRAASSSDAIELAP